MTRLPFFLCLFLAACLLSGCESDAARERRMKAEAQSKVAEDDQGRQDTFAHQEALRAVELAKQHDLDGVEQRRTGNVYAHSCRKAVAFDPSMPASVDTKGCSPDQLNLETEAERRQMFDDAFKSVNEKKRN